MGKYTPLAEHLASQPQNETRLTFAQVEQIISAPLAGSAREHFAWWANSRTADSHTWAHEWIAAGWERAAISLSEQWVVFRRVEFFEEDSPEALEGYAVDRRLLQRARSSGLVAKRKQLDDYSCQACGFRLEVGGRFVAEVHHTDPLGAGEERVTKLDELVTLCPTCHRIAHLRSLPYSVEEIRQLRVQPH